MASLFRPITVKPVPPRAESVTVNNRKCVRWRNRQGKWTVAILTDDGLRCRCRSPFWYVEYTDIDGRRQREKVSKDKAAAENRLGDIVRDVERARGGLAPISKTSTVESLATLAAEYRDYLDSQGRTEKHFTQVYNQIFTLITECNWDRTRDVGLASWSRWVAQQRSPEVDLSSETVNHYLRSIRGFFRWLVRGGRLGVDPLSNAEPLNADGDRRIIRRTLTASDFRRLIDATRASLKSRLDLAGPDRAALYLVAATTGLRAGELAVLTPADIRSDAPVPFLPVTAKRAKSRKAADVPIPASTLDELKSWLEQRINEPLLWPGNWQAHGWAADMLARDLTDAGIEPTNNEGQYDFHALRSQYGTDLARADVPIQVAQQLMRHSTPALTAKHYTRLNLVDLGAAANRLGRTLGDSKPKATELPGTSQQKTNRRKRAGNSKKPKKRGE